MPDPSWMFLIMCEALIVIVVVIASCHSFYHERDAERQQAAAGGGTDADEDTGRLQAQAQQAAAAEVRSHFPFPYAAGPFRPSAGSSMSLGMMPQAQAREVVAQLPYFPYGQGGASETLVCAVCLEQLRDGELCSQVPACRHVFHGECVGSWMKKSDSCPLCRVKIVAGLAGSNQPPVADMV